MRAGQGDDSAALSVCHFLELSRAERGVGMGGTAEGQSRGLCV